MAVALTKALFQSRTRTALLEAVLRDGVTDSLSGLARRTGLSHHAVAAEVKNLSAAGLVGVESIGGADVVRANREHPAFGVVVQLLAVADAVSPDDGDAPVKESLAHFGAPLRARKRRRHLGLETALARGLSVARRDPALLEALPVVLLKNRKALDWAVLEAEARRLKVKRELRRVVELTADVSGRAELKAHVADLEDRRRNADAFVADEALRAAIRKRLPSAGRPSLAARDAGAAERERIRRMSAADRALLALDLGERLAVFRRPRG